MGVNGEQVGGAGEEQHAVSASEGGRAGSAEAGCWRSAFLLLGSLLPLPTCPTHHTCVNVTLSTHQVPHRLGVGQARHHREGCGLGAGQHDGALQPVHGEHLPEILHKDQ